MSTKLDQITDDIKTAMKAGDKERLLTLRSIHAQIKDATVNKGIDPTDDHVADVLAKAVKQRLESIRQFQDGGRDDLAAKEESELSILKAYQPEQLSDEAVQALVTAAIQQTAAAGKQDMGKVMAVLMPQVKGKADGSLVSRLVQQALG
ncbi:MAG: GatB/YqeY domain-containing protein [Verrucomicrobia bacterium]|nr:GatB/YqeY domain-containing protein [Verrucomicrobiota bacterium]